MRTFIYVTFFLFAFNNVYAADTSKSFDTICKAVRDSDARIAELHQGTQKKCIIYIEDAHCNYLAQKELSQIIDSLTKSLDIDLITVEGAQGDVMTHLFASFPVDTTRKKLSENLLKKGLITGEEYYSIYHGAPLNIVGVDDAQLYRENLGYFNTFFALHDTTTAALEQLRCGLCSIKKNVYNSSLFEFDQICLAFRQGTTDLVHLIDGTLEQVPGSGTIIDEYSELSAAYSLFRQQQVFPYDRLQDETKDLIQRSAEYVNETVSEDLKQLLFQHLTGKCDDTVFFAQLLAAAQRYMADQPHRYALLAKHQYLSDQIAQLDASLMQAQLDEFINACYNTLLSNDIERELFALSEQFQRLEHLLTLNMSREEFSAFIQTDQYSQALHTFFDRYKRFAQSIPFDDTGEISLNTCSDATLKFYQTAAQRDTILLENTISEMKRCKQDTAILIAGGFHTQAVLEECRRQDISCLVLRPALVGKNDFNRYASVLLRKEIEPSAPQTALQESMLRAASFFAWRSFDDLDGLTEFRNRFIFSAILNSLNEYTRMEVFRLVKHWRAAFAQAVQIRYPANSQRYTNSVALFDFLVTDVFSRATIELSPQDKTMTVFINAKILKVSLDRFGKAQLERRDDIPRKKQIEHSLELKRDQIRLNKTHVFIAPCAQPDNITLHELRSDTNYAAHYIQALNLRGIEPVVILPSDSKHFETLRMAYADLITSRALRFKIAIFDNRNLMQLDQAGAPSTNLKVQGKPLVINFIAPRDEAQAQRLTELDRLFMNQNPSMTRPILVRIPMAGAELCELSKLDIIDVFTQTPHTAPHLPRSIETGIAIDADLLSMLQHIRSTNRGELRKEVIDTITETTKDTRLHTFFAAQTAPFEGGWNVRYLRDTSDAELCAFFTALHHTGTEQLIFTFLKQDDPAQSRHKEFLKKHTCFIDLEQTGNDRVDRNNTLTVINLPDTTEPILNMLLAASDTAALSDEALLSTALVLNKFDTGPSILFRPPHHEQQQVLRDLFERLNMQPLFGHLQYYMDITDHSDVDYFEDFSAAGPLNTHARNVYELLFDPQLNSLMHFGVGRIVKPVNALNTVVDLIRDIDEGQPREHIVMSHTYGTTGLAVELVNTWMLDDTIDPFTTAGQQAFITRHLIPALKEAVMGMNSTGHSDSTIQAMLAALRSDMISHYSNRLDELTPAEAASIAASFELVLTSFFTSIDIIENGHLFIPVATDRGMRYEHVYIKWMPFHPARHTSPTPVIKSELLMPFLKERMSADLRDREIIRVMINDVFGRNYLNTVIANATSDEHPPNYHHTARQIELLEGRIADVLMHDLRRLAERYRHELIAFAGNTGMHALHSYLKSEQSQYSEIRLNFSAIIVNVTQYATAPDSHTTSFFRDSQGWLPELQSYLSDLIFHKSMRRDYTITMRSIGSSIGKEPYALAMVTAHALDTYARTHVYNYLSDGPAKDDAVNQWVEQWDVRIYAFDRGINRLATTLTGAYTLSAYEINFFEAHPEFAAYFTDYTPQDHGKTAFAYVHERLRHWIFPQFVDFEASYQHITRLRSEITFIMNILPYLNNAQEIYTAMRNSTHSEYKSFFAYNEQFNSTPNDLHVLAGQKLVIPPQQISTASEFAARSLLLHSFSPEAIAHNSGVTPEILINCISTAPAHHLFAGNAMLYRTSAETLIRTLFERIDATQTQAAMISVQNDFIDNELRAAIKEFIVQLIMLGFHEQHIEHEIRNFTDALRIEHQRERTKRSMPAAAALAPRFADAIIDIVTHTEVIGNHFFMPRTMNGAPFFEHTYVERTALRITAGETAALEIKSEHISPSTKQRIAQNVRDLSFARRLIELMDIRFDSSSLNATDLPPAYKGNADQQAILSTAIAESMLGLIRRAAHTMEPVLEPLYGSASIEALFVYYQQIEKLHDTPLLPVLREEYDAMRALVTGRDQRAETMQMPQALTTSQPVFFDSRQDIEWTGGLKEYLSDLIIRKVAAGDFSITIRTINGWMCKEAYTIAAIAETALLSYAYNHIYDDESDPLRRKALVEEWVDLWDVQVHAFDSSVHRLAVAATGAYRLTPAEFAFVAQHPDYSRLFSVLDLAPASETDAISHYAQVNDRLRRWLVPQYMNVTDDVSALHIRPAEITFIGALPDNLDTPDTLVRAVFDTINPDYKSYIGYHDAHSRAVCEQNVAALMPHIKKTTFIIAPRTMPGEQDIYEIVLAEGLDDPGVIAATFGVERQYAESIFQPEIIRYAEQLISQYASDPLLSLEQTGDHSIFVESILKPFIITYAMEQFQQGTSSSQIQDALRRIAIVLPLLYEDELYKQLRGLAIHLREQIHDFMSTVELDESGHLFIEQQFEGSPLYEHHFLHYRTYYPDTDHTGALQVVSEYLTAAQRSHLATELHEQSLVLSIMERSGAFNFDKMFELWKTRNTHDNMELSIWDDMLAFAVLKDPAPSLKRHIATLVCGYFQDVAQTYRNQIQAQTGLTGLEGLAAFVAHISDSSLAAHQIEQFDAQAFRQDIAQAVAPMAETLLDFIPGVTRFFRDHQQIIGPMSDYLDGLIAQKYARGDMTITGKAIGISNGKEPYSVAYLIEQALLRYAHRYVYHDIADDTVRNRLADKWVDAWDVKIYGYEKVIQRLLLAREGVYTLSPKEVAFFNDNEQFKNMFELIDDSHTQVTVAVVKPRLKRWLVPIQTDLNEEMAGITAMQSEITFAHNFFYYLNDPEQAYKLVAASFNPQYPSFFVYNRRVNTLPVELNQIPGQPYTLPSQTMPDPMLLSMMANTYRDMGKPGIIARLGLSPEQAEHVEPLLTEFERLYGRIDEALQSTSDAFLNDTTFEHAVLDEIGQFVSDFVLERIMKQNNAEDIKEQLPVLYSFAQHVVLAQAARRDIDAARCAILNQHIRRYVDGIEISALGDVFIRLPHEEPALYMRRYIDMQAYTPGFAADVQPICTQTYVESATKEQLMHEQQDIALITSIIATPGIIDWDSIISSWQDENTLRQGPLKFGAEFLIMRDFAITAGRIHTVQRHFAALNRTYFTTIADRYADRITCITGTQGLAGLAQYVQRMHADDPAVAAYDNTGIRHDIAHLLNYMNQPRYETGSTLFFRDNQLYLKELENFISDLIILKTAQNDYSLTIRDIGASTGKETYILAAVVEYQLRKYAEELYKSIDDPQQRIEYIEKWIGRWHVRIYAYEKSPDRLLLLEEGLYALNATEEATFDDYPHYRSMFITIGQFGERLLARVHPRFKQWIIPMPVDSANDPEELYNNPAEITLAMNMLYQQEDREALIRVMHESAQREYKSFLAYNRRIEYKKPGAEEYPVVLPPTQFPAAAHIETVFEALQLSSGEKLKQLFGLNMEQLAELDLYFNIRPLARSLMRHYQRSFRQSFNQPQLHAVALRSMTLDVLRSFLMDSLRSGASSEAIQTQLTFLQEQLVVFYTSALAEQHTPDSQKAVASFRSLIEETFSTIELTMNTAVLIPEKYTPGMYEYLYRTMYPDGTTEITTERISATENEHVRQRSHDIYYANLILELYPIQFPLTEYIALNDLVDTITDSALLTAHLRNQRAKQSIEAFKALAHRHTQRIARISDTPGLQGLYEYLSTQRITADTDSLTQELLELINHHEPPQDQGDIPVFFEDYAVWLHDMRSCMHDLIIQKIAYNDLSFTIRHIGSGTGKVPYSLGAVLEQELLSYARKNLFMEMDDMAGREMRIQNWVDSWNIHIIAIDTDPARLLIAQQGVYRYDHAECAFFDPGHTSYALMKQYRASFLIDQEQTTIRPSPRLKRWVEPTLLTCNGDLTPLGAFEAEITVANTLQTAVLNPDALIAKLLESVNPAYKAYISYDDAYTPSFSLLSSRFSGADFHIIAPRSLPPMKVLARCWRECGHDDQNWYAQLLGIDLSYGEELTFIIESLEDLDDTILHLFHATNVLPTDAALEDFFNNDLRVAVRERFSGLLLDGIDTHLIRKHIPQFRDLLIAQYEAYIFSKQIPHSESDISYVTMRAENFFHAVTISDNRELILPLTVYGCPMIEQVIVKPDVFTTSSEEQDALTAITRIVTPEQLRDHQQRAADRGTALKILSAVMETPLEMRFHGWSVAENYMNQPGFIPLYAGTPVLAKAVKDTIIDLLIPPLYGILHEYADAFNALYGTSDMHTLARFVTDRNAEDLPEFEGLLPKLKVLVHYMDYFLNNDEAKFFENEQLWFDDMKEFLSDLIMQKAARGDYTLTLTNIAASFGKEAVSMAVIVEMALYEFAHAHLFSDVDNQLEREYQIEQWIDSWHIEIFAVDSSLPKLAALREGVMLITEDKTNVTDPLYVDEYRFFKTRHPELLNRIFAQTHELEPATVYARGTSYVNQRFIAKVRQRLLHWITPVFFNPYSTEPLAAAVPRPSEVVVALNNTDYLNSTIETQSQAHRQSRRNQLITAMGTLTNPDYKSLLVHTVSAGGTPAHDSATLIRQVQINAPVAPPSFEDIHRLVSQYRLRSINNTVAILGLSSQQQRQVQGYFEQYEQITNLIDNFYLAYPKLFTTPEGQRRFINELLHPHIRTLLADAAHNTHQFKIDKVQFDTIRKLVRLAYTEKLHAEQVSASYIAINNLENLTGRFLDDIEIVDGMHLFIPIVEGNDISYDYSVLRSSAMTSYMQGLFEHVITDSLILDTYPSTSLQQPEYRVDTMRISSARREDIMADHHDVNALMDLFSADDMDDMFPFVVAETVPVAMVNAANMREDAGAFSVTHWPNLPIQPYNTLAEREAAMRHLLYCALPFFRELREKYATALYTHYKRSDMSALRDYIIELRSQSRIMSGEPKHPLLQNVSEFILQFAQPYTPENISASVSSSPTSFFSGSQHWLTQIQRYLADSIAYKVVAGDFSLSARSIGCGNGKEPYSIAAIIEQQLIAYARDVAFADMTPGIRKNMQIEEWVSRWDVRVLAIDNMYQRTAYVSEGLYMISDEEFTFLADHPEYNTMFETLTTYTHNDDAVVGIGRLNARIRSWVTSVRLDVIADMQMLASMPSEITVAMNVFPFLETQEADMLYTTLTEPSHPRYKSFFLHNYSLGSAPSKLFKVAGQPYVLPPRELPPSSVLEMLALFYGMKSMDELSGLIGLSEQQKDSVTKRVEHGHAQRALQHRLSDTSRMVESMM